MIKDNKIFKFIRENIKYVFVFLVALVALTFFSNLNCYDAAWNYGFSYAFSKGEIPFKDFNMITPGLYNFVMSLGLHISHNNLMFLIEQSLLITLTFSIVYKMYGKKSFLFLFFMAFPSFFAFTPTYNFFLMFLIIFLIYLEKEEKSDYLIGVVLALCILTKHTVGVFLIIPSFIFYFKDKSKLFKRFIGCLIPGVIYIVYLLIIGAFKYFFDLCVLGLFDFASKNGEFVLVYVVLSFILLALNILYIIFNKKDIMGYYILCFFSVMIPIFTFYHFSVYLALCSLMLLSILKNKNISDNYIGFLGIILTLITFSFNLIIVRGEYFFHVHNFDYLYSNKESRDNFKRLNSLYLKYRDDSSVNILSSKGVLIKIINEEKLDYYMVPLNGNFGYNGTLKMINKVRDNDKNYYIIDMKEYRRTKKYGGQFAVDLCDYIMKNSKVIEENEDYNVYYYEGAI